MKAAIGIIATMSLIALVLAVIGYIWWASHKDTLRADIRTAISDGRTFGAQATAAKCLNAAVARTKDCDGFACTVADKAYLNACLSATHSDAGFCRGVPLENQMFKSVKWAIQTCHQRGVKNQSCPHVARYVLKYCAAAH